MSRKIIEKCLEELSNKKPNVAYIKGMLEAILEMSPSVNLNSGVIPMMNKQVLVAPELTDEEREANSLAVRYAGGPIGSLS